MPEALYHQHGKSPVSFHVVGKDDEGNLHLATTPNGKPSIFSVPVSEKPLDGHVTLTAADAKAIAATKSKSKAAAAKESAEADAAAAAAAKAEAEVAAKAAAEADAK